MQLKAIGSANSGPRREKFVMKFKPEIRSFPNPSIPISQYNKDLIMNRLAGDSREQNLIMDQFVEDSRGQAPTSRFPCSLTVSGG